MVNVDSVIKKSTIDPDNVAAAAVDGGNVTDCKGINSII